MRRQLFTFIIAGLLIAGCEKIPPPETSPIRVKFYDLQGKPVVDLYEGLQVKLVSEDFKRFAQQQIDLKKDGKVQFDQLIAPVDSVGPDFIITRVPLMNYIQPLYLAISLQVSNQIIPLCNVCLPYRPRVRGRILTGHDGTNPDGQFEMPAEMTLDAAGNMYVIDQRDLHDVVLRVTPAGEVSTFAGASGEFGRLVGIGINNGTNKMYLADAIAQRVFELNMSRPGSVAVLAGSGAIGNADGTGTAASFHFGDQMVDDFSHSEHGQGLALDATGNIYVGENIDPAREGSQIRKITPAGVVSTVPGSLFFAVTSENETAVPSGIVISPTNDIWYVTGRSGYIQGVVRVNTDGTSSRPAGKDSFEGLNDGVGTAAQFSYPKAIATSGTNFYVADGTNGALRRVTPAGEVITLAGVGHFNTDRFVGPVLPPLQGTWLMPGLFLLTPGDYYEIAAASIRMGQAGGVAVTNSGRTIYVSDHWYKCIWKITIG